MSPITHFLIGWAVANSDNSLNPRERAMVTWASVIPDLDGLGLIAEITTRNWEKPLTWWTDYHHILGHNLTFALVCAAIAMVFAERRVKVGLLVLASFHLHLLGDVAGARGPDGDQWPIPYLMPFSHLPAWTWSGQWPLNGWPNMLLTATLIALSIHWARNRGYSPVSVFSERADAAVVKALRGFGRCNGEK